MENEILSQILKKLAIMGADIKDLKQGQAELKAEVAEVKSDVKKIKSELDYVWEDIRKLDECTYELRRIK